MANKIYSDVTSPLDGILFDEIAEMSGGFSLGQLLRNRQAKKMISSYDGENKEFERQNLSGEPALEFNSQGITMDEMRAKTDAALVE